MSQTLRAIIGFAVIAVLIFLVGQNQSWNVALAILNLCLISAVMALGVNIQWGYAGLFNVGIMGFAALGGVAAVLVSQPIVTTAWSAGGGGILLSGLAVLVLVGLILLVSRRMSSGWLKSLSLVVLVIGGYIVIRSIYGPGGERD